MLKIVNKSTLLKDRAENGFALESKVYNANDEEVVRLKKVQTLKSAGAWDEHNPNYLKHWNKIEDLRKKAVAEFKANGAVLTNNGFDTPNDLYEFIDQVRLDITAAFLYEADYTPLIANIISDNDFDEVMKLNGFLPYGAHFKKISGKGQPVSLVEPKTGVTDTVEFSIFGVGFVRTLHSLLFDKLFELKKVNAAVARALAFTRNERNIEVLTSYPDYAANSQYTAANNDAAATLDQKIYRTFKLALENMACFPHPQYTNGKQKLDISSGVWLVMNSCDVPKVAPVLRGAINSATSPENLEPLTGWLKGIIVYNGDIMTVGEEQFTLDGVAQGSAFLVSPGWAYSMRKRGLTVQTGPGRALELSQDETAWYISEAEYYTDALKAVMEVEIPT